MIIAIENGLNEIEESIRKSNEHKIVRIGEYQGAIDVFIYKEKANIEKFEGYQFKIENIALKQHGQVDQGILMINVNQKKGIEVMEILKKYEKNKL